MVLPQMLGGEAVNMASSCVLALRLFLEGKATFKGAFTVSSSGPLPCQSCPMPASLHSESGKMFSSFERFLVCLEEEDSQHCWGFHVFGFHKSSCCNFMLGGAGCWEGPQDLRSSQETGVSWV